MHLIIVIFFAMALAMALYAPNEKITQPAIDLSIPVLILAGFDNDVSEILWLDDLRRAEADAEAYLNIYNQDDIRRADADRDVVNEIFPIILDEG